MTEPSSANSPLAVGLDEPVRHVGIFRRAHLDRLHGAARVRHGKNRAFHPDSVPVEISVLGNLGRIVKGHGTALPVHLDVVLVEGQFPLLGYGIFLQGNGAQPFAQFLHHLPLQVPPAPHGGMIPPPWAGTAVIGKKGGCRAHDPEVP